MDGEQPSAGRGYSRSATEDLWARTLSQIPSRLGQMAYLSRLRNPQTGQYEHHGLIAMFGESSAIDALRRSHFDVFRSFLSLRLLDQLEDFRRFLSANSQPAKRLLMAWERNKGYETLLPPETSEAERELFGANMHLIMHHLQGEEAAADSDPSRSPRQ